MRITYLGPSGAVELSDGTALPRGQAVEVPDAIGVELTTTREDEFTAASSAEEE